MKAKLLTLLLIASTGAIAATYCPCPGPCCPMQTDSLIEETNYLSPWATLESSEALIEKDLEAHRI